MGEIIQLNFGDIGNNIGHQYLEKLIDDHYLDETKSYRSDQYRQKIHVSFEELRDRQFQFRGIFENSSDQSINKLLTSPECENINNDLLLQNQNRNKSGTFSNSQTNFRDQVQDELFEKLRHHIEKCDKFFGCHFVHSTFDNSSGSSSSAINQYRKRYFHKLCSSFWMFPNIENTNTIEIYNTAFSLHGLIEISLENQLIKLRQQCTFENCNNVIAECLLQMNCSQRFSGHQNGDLRKLSTNLVHYPRQHFLTCAFTPIEINQDLNYQLTNLSLPNNTYFSFQNPTRNLYIAQALITRCNSYNLDFNKLRQHYQIRQNGLTILYYIQIARLKIDIQEKQLCTLGIIKIWDLTQKYIVRCLLLISEEKPSYIIIYKMVWMKWNSLRLNHIQVTLSLSIFNAFAECQNMMKRSKVMNRTYENNYKLLIIHKQNHFLGISREQQSAFKINHIQLVKKLAYFSLCVCAELSYS
ncbi:unnamed protein product [Paramecium octaurelia]|uniref:Tubulin/FtsZ GTPase domain-containing protein n=1 Tax=Paramecium octaurelia TaxID=43137 RepID=A0A8S1YN38_PAROT|nr:unnamed protein product [Paramecium octaurelia]